VDVKKRQDLTTLYNNQGWKFNDDISLDATIN
jgi:hypothetical protein